MGTAATTTMATASAMVRARPVSASASTRVRNKRCCGGYRRCTIVSSANDVSQTQTQIDVTLSRPLGLTLQGGVGGVGAVVDEVVGGGNAEKNGEIRAGDVLVACGSEGDDELWPCATELFDDILAVIAADPDSNVSLRFDRAKEGSLSNTAGRAFLAANAQKEGVRVTKSGLQIRVMEEGTGSKVPSLDAPCVCHYKGTLINGQEFDSSYSRGKPATFKPNQVIKGWREALLTMREGDKVELVVPCELGYGNRGSGQFIKKGDVLVFEIELQRVLFM